MSHGVIVQDYLELSGLPYTNLLTASFYENALNYTTYLKQPDGSYIFSFNAGTVLLARHAVADIGQTVAGALAWLLAHPLGGCSETCHSVCSSAHFRATQLEHGPCSFSWVLWVHACSRPGGSPEVPRQGGAGGFRAQHLL